MQGVKHTQWLNEHSYDSLFGSPEEDSEGAPETKEMTKPDSNEEPREESKKTEASNSEE